MPSLKAWESFYVMAGSSSATLIGLQFVVMALITNISAPSDSRTVDAFGTPTIVHLGAVLLLSGIMTAPWPRALHLSVLLVAVGAVGVWYASIVAFRARGQTEYAPVLEDWIFHVLLPAVGYAVVAVAGYVFGAGQPVALFAVAAVVLVLLFVAIHNAWDTVTYMILVRRPDGRRLRASTADPPSAESGPPAEVQRR